MIDKEEELYFDEIKDKCKVIFDVGCRTDTFYLENTTNSEIHLFEPNPVFFNYIKENIKNIKNNNKAHLNNFGLGDKTEKLKYWEDSQTFFPRKKHFVSKSNPVELEVRSLSDYIKDNNIKKIDFLKIDVEGFEPNILLNVPLFINNNINYIQFEWASTWHDNLGIDIIFSIYETFKNNFYFYLLHDYKHPYFIENNQLLTKITGFSDIVIFVESGYGFNVIMERITDEEP